MARFRKRAKARRFGRAFGRAARRAVNVSRPEGVIIPAMVYGAGRSWLAQMVAPVTSKIPAGTYADELVMGSIAYLAAKKGRGFVKKAGMAALTVEAASVGNQLFAGMTNKGSAQTTGAYYV